MTSRLELCRLDWDSNHFGLEIARLGRPPDSGDEIATALRTARDLGIDCIYCLVEAGDFERAWRLEAAGFIARDLRLEFIRRINPEDPDLDVAHGTGALRPCVDADVGALALLSSTSFVGTRFAADPCFPQSRVACLYDVWLRNSVAGFADALLVGGPIGEPSGFVTLHANGTAGRIGLIAVDPRTRGAGLGRALVFGAIRWAARRGCTELRVVTQGSNAAAQRLYQRCGFVTNAAHTWFHAWPRITRARSDGPREFEP